MDEPVGTVKVRGNARVQKQRDGSWLKLGTVNPGLENVKPRKKALATPRASVRPPVIKPVDIPVGHKWRDEALDMSVSTMDDMFDTPEDKSEEPEPSPLPSNPNGMSIPNQEPEAEDDKEEPKEPKPKPQRKALHDRIFRTFLDNVKEVDFDEKPVAVVMTGGPLSGRTAVVSSIARELPFVRVDPEAIGILLPEYKEAVSKFARNAPDIVSDEASFLALAIVDKAVEGRKNLVVDAVGEDAADHAAFIESLQEAGYSVVLVLTDIDRADVVQRNRVRGAKTGRWVPNEYFALVSNAARTYEECCESADECFRIDTRKKPKFVSNVLEDLDELFEDETRPEKSAVPLAEIRKAALEGLKRSCNMLDALPDKYKPREGVLLAHYSDLHIQPVRIEDENGDPEGEEPADAPSL